MPHLLQSLRGTVQGVLAASRHVVRYVDWQTGGAGAGRSGITKG